MDSYIFNERNPRICIIGAGFSGMWAYIKLKTLKFGQSTNLSTNIDVYDVNKDVGGVWYSHKYPGCTADVPAHLYCFTFDPITDTKSIYSSRDELFKYLQTVAGKNGMYKNTHFEHSVRKLTWSEERTQWIAEISNLANGQNFTTTYDFIITATGLFRNPRIPDEFRTFKGHLIHTALWDPSVSLKNKRVAVIGNGSSGTQIISEIAKVAEKLVVYQRKSNWVLPKFDYDFPKLLYWVLRYVPCFVTLYRFSFLFLYDFFWNAFHNGSWANRTLTGAMNLFRKSQLKGRKDLQEALQPRFSFGCNFLSVADDYYKTFCKSNVQLITNPITQVTETSIVTADTEEVFDIIICATGFHVTKYFAPMEILTSDGQDLSKQWTEEGPSLFMGLLNHTLPNMFVIGGPFSKPVNNILSMIELQVELVSKCIVNLFKRQAKKMVVLKEYEEKYMNQMQASFKKMVWSPSACSPFFADDMGRIILFPDALKTFRSDVSSFNANQFLNYS